MQRYFYAPDGRVLGEYGANANDVKAEFIWMSPEVGESNAFGGDDGLGGYMPLAVAVPTATAGITELNWVHSDHLGVPIWITNASGMTIAQSSSYTAPAFPGQSRTLADLYYNKYRDYDPTTGRYIQADPIGLAGGTSPYSYAMNNPLRYTDPHGKIALNLVTGGLGAVFGAGGNLIGQLLRNGWDWNCVDGTDVLVAGGIGFVSGFVAPLAALGYVGAVGLGGLSNIAQTGISDYLNRKTTTSADVTNAALSGALGGAIGGGVGYGPRGTRADPEWALGDGLDQARNEAARARAAVRGGSTIRNLLGALVGN